MGIQSSIRKVLVVLSGGQDSTTCLFWAKKYFEEVHAVTFNYGQRHIRELQAAAAVAKIAGVASHEIVDLGSDVLKGMSPLTDRSQQLEQYESFEQMDKIIGDRVEKTFVPMRNMLFLTIAANRAQVLGCDMIVTGVCQEDNANYPDCRRDFIDAFEIAATEALGIEPNDLPVVTPLINLTKANAISLTMSLKSDLGDMGPSDAYVALAFTHTAYDGQYPPIGKDHATVLRAHGFEQAGVPDPLVVRAWWTGQMLLPNTPNYEDVARMKDLAASINALAEEYGVEL